MCYSASHHYGQLMFNLLGEILEAMKNKQLRAVPFEMWGVGVFITNFHLPLTEDWLGTVYMKI